MAEQTTAQRIAEDMGVPLGAAQTIAAEIDTLTRERDEARVDAVQEMIETYKGNAADHEAKIAALQAEVERLRPAAEAWEAWDALQDAIRSGTANQIGRHEAWYRAAAARARAAKESQP